MKFFLISIALLILSVPQAYSSEIVIVPTGTSDDAPHMQAALEGLQNGDTLRLNGDFVIKHTIYLPSNFTWILSGSVTLAGDADLDEAGYVDSLIDVRRRTGIAEKVGGATNINMSGGTYYGNRAQYPKSSRYIYFGNVTNSKFQNMHITEGTDDNFTLGAGCRYNECRNLNGSYAHGNALSDKGEYNTWIDCISSDCDSDGWTPKCSYSTFIRCIAANNVGPGFGMYAREEGYADNLDVGERIIGNKFIDCVSYGSLERSGFSFDISSNCPGGVIRDNYIQAVCYDNQGSGVTFRNKDDAEAGIIKDNVVDIICYGNKGLRNGGDISSWAGGLGMENDNSTSHNIIENITGSVICYDNRMDVNTRGGTNCSITVYHPEGESNPILDDKSSGNNSVTVIEFACSETLETWGQYKYCGLATPPLPEDPTGLTADAVSTSQIDLSWTDSAEEEAGFRIEQKVDEYFYVIATVDANVTSYSCKDLSENTEYTYRVQAFNISGFSDYSNEIESATDADTPISSQSVSSVENFISKIFPNPFYESATILFTVPEDAYVSLKVYDTSGREISILVDENKQKGLYSIVLNGENLSAGSYFYRIFTGDVMETKKIAILK